MRVDVDASLVARRIIRSHVQIPVSGKSVTLSYPLWAPGDHAAIQHVGQIADLSFHSGKLLLVWKRDLIDLNSFHVVFPSGTTTLTADFDLVLPAPGEAFADSSQHLLVLRWNLYILYIAGKPVSKLPVEASLMLPSDWRFSTALEERDSRQADSRTGKVVRFRETSLESLVDSPVLAGRFMCQIPLRSGQGLPHEFDVAAESEGDLPTAFEIYSKYSELIEQARELFGSEHYRGYRFLVTASNYTTPGAGFEHAESSDTRVPSDFFHNASRSITMGDLLPHELAHSWNGKFRRPADLYPVDYQIAEKTDLLWVYESLTDYVGVVLATRSGFRSVKDSLEYWAAIAAKVDHETGRTWRSMQDTADSVPVTMNEVFFAPPSWNSWLRMLDYYDEGALLWLAADQIIVDQTKGQKSLGDFLHLFYAGPSGSPRVKTYDKADVIQALNKVAVFDWHGFFDQRLRSLSPHAPLAGLERSGWRLVYTTEPNTFLAAARPDGLGSTMNSVGFAVGSDGTVSDVLRGGPADAVGLTPGMKVVAVDGHPWAVAPLLAAITDSGTSSSEIRLLTQFAGVSQTFAISYHNGARYPHLERLQNRQDRLTKVFTPLPVLQP